MKTLELINIKGIECIEALKRGEILDCNQKACLKIYTQLNGKPNNRSGKRKIIKTGK